MSTRCLPRSSSPTHVRARSGASRWSRARLPPIVLRPARLEDARTLVAIFRDTFESTWRPQITVAAAEAFIAADQATAYVAERGAELRVAERDGRVVGLTHWRHDFVHALHVRADAARVGIGSRLMDLAEAEIAMAGFAKVRLETDTFNVASRAFYTARGFEEIERYPDTAWDSGLMTLLLEKRLS